MSFTKLIIEGHEHLVYAVRNIVNEIAPERQLKVILLTSTVGSF